ncbi:hypothetical protein PybrP1_011693 [[Pythium] brassicae (nom. inval.)]|nr:hypothetical protein PybrP1_011693 [[Pythium] brassicae (nom. inval.)]
MTSTSTAVLRDALRRPLEAPDALAVLFFTSDWAAPAESAALALLRAATGGRAGPTEGNRVRVAVLRQHLQPPVDAGSSDTDALETAVANDAFRELCKRFGVVALPAVVVVDAALERVENPQLPAHAAVLLESVNDALNGKPPASASSAADETLAEMRDEATSLFESGDFLAAASLFVRVLRENPACPKANFNLAVILQMLGETYFAVHFLLQVVAADDNDSVAHTVLRSVYYPVEPDAVVAGYEAIIAAAPHHVRAVHSLATLRGAATSAAPAYVQKVFDELAETFEEKLVTHLEYRVPWLLVDALSRVQPSVFVDLKSAAGSARPAAARVASPTWRVADVGCGTGLCGRLLRPFVAHIVGVDISPLMIEKTRDAGSYDELQIDDIDPFLSNREDASLDLVIAADVWIYVGALDDIFALCARKLTAGGWLAFSTELLAPSSSSSSTGDGLQVGVKLAASGRFQHSEQYIADLAAASGFAVRLAEAVSVRKESGEAIPGRVYLLQKAIDSATAVA